MSRKRSLLARPRSYLFPDATIASDRRTGAASTDTISAVGGYRLCRLGRISRFGADLPVSQNGRVVGVRRESIQLGQFGKASYTLRPKCRRHAPRRKRKSAMWSRVAIEWVNACVNVEQARPLNGGGCADQFDVRNDQSIQSVVRRDCCRCGCAPEWMRWRGAAGAVPPWAGRLSKSSRNSA